MEQHGQEEREQWVETERECSGARALECAHTSASTTASHQGTLHLHDYTAHLVPVTQSEMKSALAHGDHVLVDIFWC